MIAFDIYLNILYIINLQLKLYNDDKYLYVTMPFY